MSVIRDMSHSAIGPCGLSKQSPFGDTLRYASTAFFKSSLECGEYAGGRAWGLFQRTGALRRETWKCERHRCVSNEVMRDLGFEYVHAPLQEFGNILMKSIGNSKRICTCWQVALFAPVSYCAPVYICVYLCVSVCICTKVHGCLVNDSAVYRRDE